MSEPAREAQLDELTAEELAGRIAEIASGKLAKDIRVHGGLEPLGCLGPVGHQLVEVEIEGGGARRAGLGRRADRLAGGVGHGDVVAGHPEQGQGAAVGDDLQPARALRDGMNATLARRKVRGVAYGEASMFRLAFDPRLLPGDPASLRNVPGDALKSQRQTPVAQYLTLALLLEGVHLLGWGGFVSTAHTTEDISRTVRALDAAVDHLEALMPR